MLDTSQETEKSFPEKNIINGQRVQKLEQILTTDKIAIHGPTTMTWGEVLGCKYNVSRQEDVGYRITVISDETAVNIELTLSGEVLNAVENPLRASSPDITPSMYGNTDGLIEIIAKAK